MEYFVKIAFCLFKGTDYSLFNALVYNLPCLTAGKWTTICPMSTDSSLIVTEWLDRNSEQGCVSLETFFRKCNLSTEFTCMVKPKNV